MEIFNKPASQQARLLSFACSSLFLFSNSHAEDSVDAAQHQIPTEKEAIEARAAFLKENAPAAPLPAGSPNLETLRTRVANLQQKQAAYLQNLAAGKTAPFPEIRENWPQFQATVKGLQTDLQSLDAEKDPAKRAELSKALFAALQPIGFLLEGVDYDENFTGRLTTAQTDELDSLTKEWEAALPPLI